MSTVQATLHDGISVADRYWGFSIMVCDDPALQGIIKTRPLPSRSLIINPHLPILSMLSFFTLLSVSLSLTNALTVPNGPTTLATSRVGTRSDALGGSAPQGAVTLAPPPNPSNGTNPIGNSTVSGNALPTVSPSKAPEAPGVSQAPQQPGNAPSQAPQQPGNAPSQAPAPGNSPSQAPQQPGPAPSQAPQQPGSSPSGLGDNGSSPSGFGGNGSVPSEAPQQPDSIQSQAPEAPGSSPSQSPDIPDSGSSGLPDDGGFSGNGGQGDQGNQDQGNQGQNEPGQGDQGNQGQGGNIAKTATSTQAFATA